MTSDRLKSWGLAGFLLAIVVVFLAIVIQAHILDDTLEASALVLAIVNGVVLLYQILRDRPSLRLSLVHPDYYQWWYRFPDEVVDGVTIRKFGFLVYFGVDNLGYRPTTMVKWRLFVKVPEKRKAIELRAQNIPHPRFKGPFGEKYLNVFGQITPGREGFVLGSDTFVGAGAGVSGTAFYSLQVYGPEGWNPIIVDGKIEATLAIKDISERTYRIKVAFSEKSYEEYRELVDYWYEYEASQKDASMPPD